MEILTGLAELNVVTAKQLNPGMLKQGSIVFSFFVGPPAFSGVALTWRCTFIISSHTVSVMWLPQAGEQFCSVFTDGGESYCWVAQLLPPPVVLRTVGTRRATIRNVLDYYPRSENPIGRPHQTTKRILTMLVLIGAHCFYGWDDYYTPANYRLCL